MIGFIRKKLRISELLCFLVRLHHNVVFYDLCVISSKKTSIDIINRMLFDCVYNYRNRLDRLHIRINLTFMFFSRIPRYEPFYYMLQFPSNTT